MPCQDVPEEKSEPSTTRTSGGRSKSLVGSTTPNPEMPPLETTVSLGNHGTLDGKERSMGNAAGVVDYTAAGEDGSHRLRRLSRNITAVTCARIAGSAANPSTPTT